MGPRPRRPRWLMTKAVAFAFVTTIGLVVTDTAYTHPLSSEGPRVVTNVISFTIASLLITLWSLIRTILTVAALASLEIQGAQEKYSVPEAPEQSLPHPVVAE